MLTPPARRSALLAPAVLGACVLASCRADQTIAPVAACATPAASCVDGAAVLDAAAVEALDDAVARLLPPLGDEATRTELTRTLSALRADLQAGRPVQARLHLAAVYGAIARGEGTADAPSVDVVDLAAVRLALVPVANLLGVLAP